MDKTTVMAEFVIKGDNFDPQIITDSLEIKPTRCYSKNTDKKSKTYTSEEVPKTLQKLSDSEIKTLFSDKDFKRKIIENTLYKGISLWAINTGYEESYDINDQLAKIYELLKDKIDKLNNLREKHALSYTIEIVPHIENDDKPAMYFDHYIIDFAHQIKADIDIDLYIYS